MKQIKTTAAVTFGPGAILKLSDGQAALRAGRLKILEGGLYETLSEIQFKAGEEFGYEGTLSKAMLELVDVDGHPGKPAPEPKPKAKGPVKFVMPKATDTPDAVRERLEKASKGKGAKPAPAVAPAFTEPHDA